MAEAATVQVRYELTVSSKEAQAILDLCQSDGLPQNFPRGMKRDFGNGLYGVLKKHGLLQSSGTGSGTMITTVPHVWNEVIFRVDVDRSNKQMRWREIPEADRPWVKPLAWLDNLRTVSFHKARRSPTETQDKSKIVPSGEATVQTEVVGSSIAPRVLAVETPLDLSLTIAQLELAVAGQREETEKVLVECRSSVERFQEAEKVVAECRPFVERLRVVQEKLRTYENNLADVRRAQNFLLSK